MNNMWNIIEEILGGILFGAVLFGVVYALPLLLK